MPGIRYAMPAPRSSRDPSTRIPVVGITLGDPAGIGAEILLKAWPTIRRLGGSVPVVIGDTAVLERALRTLGPGLRRKRSPESAAPAARRVEIVPEGILRSQDYPIARHDAVCGRASHAYVETGLRLWKEGALDALVTLPVSKKAWELAGVPFPGHTELILRRLGNRSGAMVMAAGTCRCLLVTGHLPLREVPRRLTIRLLLEKARIGHRFLRKLGFRKPVLGVCGLNPHAGEEELLGSEERAVILPAIRRLVAEGIACVGPLPSDAVFRLMARDGFPMALCMYHDQAMPYLKTVHFDRLVNITAGIPLVRTSPGHGTAFDIAYTGNARPESFLEAYAVAVEMACRPGFVRRGKRGDIAGKQEWIF